VLLFTSGGLVLGLVSSGLGLGLAILVLVLRIWSCLHHGYFSCLVLTVLLTIIVIIIIP